MSGHVGPGEEVLFDQIQWGRGSVWECGRCRALVHLDGQGGHARWHYAQDVFLDEVYRRVRDLSRSTLP